MMLPRSWRKPFLSVIVVIYRMPEPAKKTLFSLCAEYQRKVFPSDYEVIVVENKSDLITGEDEVGKFGNRFRYFLREENTNSPVEALNFGVEKARGKMVAVMIDGARMLTPGVIRYTLTAGRMDKNALVSLPGYHLGERLQQEAVDSGYGSEEEAGLMDRIKWPEDGYRLFGISCFSGTSAAGFFNPMAESNYLAMSKHLYEKIGGFDPRFDLPGGGFANLDFYKRCCESPETNLYILFGEGSFHQFHGGVTTGRSKTVLQETVLPELVEQYQRIRGEKYSPPRKEAVYLGHISEGARKFVHVSSEKVLARHGG